MKSLKVVMSAFVLLLLGVSANAQSCHDAKAGKGACCAKATSTASNSEGATAGSAVFVANVTGEKTETFKVYGNCGMCKKTIEGSLKGVEGVSAADWDQETKIITVSFDPASISLDDIKQKIADVGYDSDSHRAKDEVYNSLHGCCQYERAKS